LASFESVGEDANTTIEINCAADNAPINLAFLTSSISSLQAIAIGLPQQDTHSSQLEEA
jgi:hypothetical protein